MLRASRKKISFFPEPQRSSREIDLWSSATGNRLSHRSGTLQKKEIKRIALGNTDTVPAGRYAKETLGTAKLFEALRPKMIFTENVRQVLDYVERGEVEAGFVFATDAMTAKKSKLAFVVDEKMHRPIIYGITVIKESKQPDLAKAFLAYVKSKGKTVLAKHGFQ
jgi:molybdate transport system substrate-binding protein